MKYFFQDIEIGDVFQNWTKKLGDIFQNEVFINIEIGDVFQNVQVFLSKYWGNFQKLGNFFKDWWFFWKVLINRTSKNFCLKPWSSPNSCKSKSLEFGQ